jgi:DNA-binding FadR family transcriptional regulator
MTEVANPAVEESGAAPPRRLTEVVHHALFERISHGHYPRNTRLPSERELSLEFDVSRPVVRAALARLREAGLVQSVKGSGTLVLHETASFPDIVPAGTTVRDLQRCFEFRVLIEGEAAYFASIRASAPTIARIREDIRASDAARLRGASEFGQSFDFHRAVAAASDNDFYVKALADICNVPAFRIYIGRSYKMPDEKARLSLVYGEHRHILGLIERREAEEARAAMRVHIERARDNFMECLPLGLTTG